MKKQIIKKMCVALTLACTVASGSGNYANASVTAQDGDLTIDEGASEYVQTEEEKELLESKLAQVEAMSKKVRSGSTNVVLNVPVFTQSNTYYCGPATVKQVLHYLNGSSLSQSKYASMLGTTSSGTDMTMIDNVLNDCQSSNSYVYQEINDYNVWSSNVSFSIRCGFPVVIDINSRNNGKWMYRTSGHFMNIAGYNDIGSETIVTVTDPHYKYSGTYDYSADLVYDVNMAHFRHAIIW